MGPYEWASLKSILAEPPWLTRLSLGGWWPCVPCACRLWASKARNNSNKPSRVYITVWPWAGVSYDIDILSLENVQESPSSEEWVSCHRCLLHTFIDRLTVTSFRHLCAKMLFSIAIRADCNVVHPEAICSPCHVIWALDQSIYDWQSSLYVLFCFFLSAVPPKGLAPFSYILAFTRPKAGRAVGPLNFTQEHKSVWYGPPSKAMGHAPRPARDWPVTKSYHRPAHTPRRRSRELRPQAIAQASARARGDFLKIGHFAPFSFFS